MTIKEITNRIEEFAPLSISYDIIKNGGYDNSGLMIGSVEKEVTKTIICVDVCDFIVDMAIANGCNLIISHHPCIYAPIKNITNDNYRGKLIQKIIKHDITVYSAHLNLDMTCGGIDDEVARILGIKTELVYKKMNLGGYGKFGSVLPIKFNDYVSKIKSEFHSVISTKSTSLIKNIISFCGSGVDTGAVKFAIENKADVVVSCDIQHHFVVELMENGINVIGLSHGESELKAMTNIMRRENILKKQQNLNIRNLVFDVDFRME